MNESNGPVQKWTGPFYARARGSKGLDERGWAGFVGLAVPDVSGTAGPTVGGAPVPEMAGLTLLAAGVLVLRRGSGRYSTQ